MARINTRPSVQASSRYASETPGPTSDQENNDPGARASKGKEKVMGPPPSRTSLPTPSSGSSTAGAGAGQKRKRATAEEAEEEDEEEPDFNKYFDPNQDSEYRRDVKRKSRNIERKFHENRDELLRGSAEGLTATVDEANSIFKHVKQTNDATVDSRLLVNVSDLAHKKAAQLVLGDTSSGVDVDEFLSKCITFMRNGGPARDDDNGGAGPSAPRRRRTGAWNEDDEEEEEGLAGDPLDWETFGRCACYPHNIRPAVPSFLLGPLSVQKKQRAQTQRRARQSKETSGKEARPEHLTKEDLQQSDENSLTATCTRIRNQLVRHIEKAEAVMQAAGFTAADMTSERGKAMMKKCRISSTGGVGLFDYVVNPRSFGQTVENIFYISFLIKEGSVGIQHDESGLPTIVAAIPSTIEQQRINKSTKHQAVLSLDHETWHQLIEAFDIRECIIPHREESEAQVGQRGWYT